MQVKIVIGTVAFMLTMMILGFAVLREPARLAEASAAAQGRSIEAGAHIYKNNCANCHGDNGKAEECYDAAGEQVGCQGLPLNNYDLLCGDPTFRMDAMSWKGTKGDFVKTTIAAGRFGTVMPVWSEQFGGPMRPDQVENVANFVLNWESEEMCAEEPIRYEWPETVAEYLASDDGANGDAANGEALFTTYGCSGCHGDPNGTADSASVGPWLGDIATVGSTRVEGLDAEQYVYESILNPNAYIVEECPTGACASPSAMPANFAARIGGAPADMADLLAYILGQ
ncbi:MAG: c-type cytochrome [Chloroflexota bacterium]